MVVDLVAVDLVAVDLVAVDLVVVGLVVRDLTKMRPDCGGRVPLNEHLRAKMRVNNANWNTCGKANTYYNGLHATVVRLRNKGGLAGREI